MHLQAMIDKNSYQLLSQKDRLDALFLAGRKSGYQLFMFEKDIWVVQILKILFEAPFGKDLVFKGGTSLSKVYNAIRRFSEDLDITYDIRAFAPDIIGDSEDAIPPNRSQEKRWTKTIRKRLEEWTREEARAVIEDGLVRAGFPVARFRTENDQVYIAYEPMFEYHGFIKPEVKVEFGARSTGEPCVERDVRCDAAVAMGELKLVPTGEAYELLAEDYEAMIRAEMFFNDPDTFENTMERCADIEARANEV